MDKIKYKSGKNKWIMLFKEHWVEPAGRKHQNLETPITDGLNNMSVVTHGGAAQCSNEELWI